MRIQFAIAAAVVLSTASLSAAASEFPTRRAGLWQTSIHVDETKMGAMSTKMCLDAMTDAKMMKYGMSQQGNQCDAPSIQGFGATRTVDAVCHMNGGTQKSHMIITYNGDASYHMDIVTKFDPPFYGRAQSHQSQDAKWMGPCPAGMKPGDMEMPGGYKVNALEMMNRPAPKPGDNPYSHMTREQLEAIMKARGGH